MLLPKAVTTVLQRPVKFLGIFLISFALFSIAGGPLALVQVFAWGKMIETYTQQGSFSVAVQKTFSGQYPCSLCKKIAEAKQKEKKAAVFNVDKTIKATLSLAVAEGILFFPQEKNYPPSPFIKNAGLSQEPPTPYPRS